MTWKHLFSPIPEKPLREQLLEARDKVRRQIEICKSPTKWSRRVFRREIAALEAELVQIEEALADLTDR